MEVSMFVSRKLLALGCMTVLVLSAAAQYPYPYPPYPYLPGPGGVLQGEASVINATGDLFVQQEQARIQREIAEQAKLDTKKKAFDLRLYEKALTPTYTEVRAKDEALLLKRIMTSPLEAEITSGKAHNVMLPFLSTLAVQGIPGPPIKLDPELMKHVNVTGETGGANIGILRNGGQVDWPLVVRGPTQKKLAAVLPKAVTAAADGSLDLALYNECSKGVAKLQEELRTKFHKEEIDGGMFIEGKRFLDSLNSAVVALRQPNAPQLLKGTYAATGRTVPELVQNMTQKGLKFAGATPGHEPSYYALYSAMVYYGNGAMDSHAFKTQFAPLSLNTQYYQKSLKSK